MSDQAVDLLRRIVEAHDRKDDLETVKAIHESIAFLLDDLRDKHKGCCEECWAARCRETHAA